MRSNSALPALKELSTDRLIAVTNNLFCTFSVLERLISFLPVIRKTVPPLLTFFVVSIVIDKEQSYVFGHHPVVIDTRTSFLSDGIDSKYFASNTSIDDPTISKTQSNNERLPTMSGIWRPELPESTDGLPLATKISDLFFDFPYDRVPADRISQFVLRPENVAKLLVFYLVSKPMFIAIAKMIDPKAAWFKYSVAIHNFLLAVFSFLVAANAWPIVLGHYKT